MSLKVFIKERLQQLGADPKRSLGQNFLISESAVQQIVRVVEGLKPSLIVEVGPGVGSLTEELLALRIRLQAIELDNKFAEYWSTERNIEVFKQDALKMNWRDLNLPSGWVLVSNLPYQISSSLVIERTLDPLECAGMVLMFQKEVAQRITAAKSTDAYGMLSVMVQPFWTVEKVTEVGPGSFWPAPKVSSRVLRFVPRESAISDPINRKKFLGLLKAGFSQRRKLVRKNLKNWVIQNNISEVISEEILSSLNIAEKARAEEISVDQWQRMYLMFAEYCDGGKE